MLSMTISMLQPMSMVLERSRSGRCLSGLVLQSKFACFVYLNGLNRAQLDSEYTAHFIIVERVGQDSFQPLPTAPRPPAPQTPAPRPAAPLQQLTQRVQGFLAGLQRAQAGSNEGHTVP